MRVKSQNGEYVAVNGVYFAFETDVLKRTSWRFHVQACALFLHPVATIRWVSHASRHLLGGAITLCPFHTRYSKNPRPSFAPQYIRISSQNLTRRFVEFVGLGIVVYLVTDKLVASAGGNSEDLNLGATMRFLPSLKMLARA